MHDWFKSKPAWSVSNPQKCTIQTHTIPYNLPSIYLCKPPQHINYSPEYVPAKISYDYPKSAPSSKRLRDLKEWILVELHM